MADLKARESTREPRLLPRQGRIATEEAASAIVDPLYGPAAADELRVGADEIVARNYPTNLKIGLCILNNGSGSEFSEENVQ